MNSDTLTLVATYRRTIQASLERIWENVRDWEHLPWLHRSSFRAIELLAQRPDGWRACVTLPPAGASRQAIVDIQMDQPNLRYWSRTLEGQGAGGEVLTYLQPVNECMTDIVVEFRMPTVSDKHAEAIGAAYLRLYKQLWDEDERMMMHRQALLDGQRIGVTVKTRKDGKRNT
jgi:hypothetical protein